MKINEETVRLYAVTDRAWVGRQSLSEQVEAAIRGGATCVQLREKELDDQAFLAEALEMKAICRKYGVPLIVNDRVEIAMRAGADGVHVGQEDMTARQVRAIIGEKMILGVTAKTVEQARQAEADGADYLGSGAVFGSATKLDAKPMTRERLSEICASVQIPVAAIGGICRQNAPELSGTGISGLAVVSGIFAAEDIEGECRALRKIADEIAGKKGKTV